MKKSSKFIVGVGNLGLSFIELIITLAIMAVVGTTVAGAMYVSSSSYTRGAAEVNVQEEAQVALNLISDWVMDATEVESPDAHRLKITHPNEDSVNVITVYQSGDKLMYQVDSDPTAYVLCEYLDSTGVTFNSTFDTDRNVNISIDFNIKGRTYHAATDTTSRNHDFTLNSTGSDVLNLTVPDSTIVLEPGMNGAAAYTFDAVVYGAASAPSITVSDQTGDISASVGTVTATGSSVYTCPVTVSSTDTASTDGSFKLSASYSDGANTFTDTEVVVTLVRRATQAVYNTSDKTYLDPFVGEAGKAGSMYVNTVNLGITNMAPRLNSAFDNGTYAYVDPSKVEFYLRYSDGTAISSSAYGITYSDHGASPSVTVTLNQDVTKDVYVYVSSVHSGSNSVTGTAPDNKTNRIKHNNFSYTSGGSSYVTYFVIKKSGDPEITDIGAGFQRGSHAFRLGRLSTNSYNDLMSFLNTVERTNYLHVVRFRYKKQSDADFGDWIYVSVRGANEGVDDWALWGNSSETQQYLADIFDCDEAYSVDVRYDLLDKATYSSIKHYESTGTVNAANMFLYNPAPSERNFALVNSTSLGSSSDPIEIKRSGSLKEFLVYFDSYNCHSNPPYKIIDINGAVERYIGPATRTEAELNNPSNWTSTGVKKPSIQGSESVPIANPIQFAGSTSKTVGGFNQNTFPDIYVTVVRNDCQAYQNSELGLYRVTYSTSYSGQRAHITSNGSMPSSSNPGSTFTMSLSNSPSETLGTVYYEIKN